MSAAATLAPAAPADRAGPIRVMIVDDAVVVRGLVARWIDEEPASRPSPRCAPAARRSSRSRASIPMSSCSTSRCPTGRAHRAAAAAGKEARPDRHHGVDADAPKCRDQPEGALARRRRLHPEAGEQPRSHHLATFRRELIEKIRHLGARRKRAPAEPRARVPFSVPSAPARAERAGAHALLGRRAARAPRRRPAMRPTSSCGRSRRSPPRVLLIGSSTGGPQALTTLVGRIAPVFERAPVLITQHMPPTFTTILAEHLARASGRTAHEAIDGEPIVPGTIYLAPGGRHMTVAQPQQSGRDLAQRRAAGQFLPPGGRSAVRPRRRRSGAARSWR